MPACKLDGELPFSRWGLVGQSSFQICSNRGYCTFLMVRKYHELGDYPTQHFEIGNQSLTDHASL